MDHIPGGEFLTEDISVSKLQVCQDLSKSLGIALPGEELKATNVHSLTDFNPSHWEGDVWIINQGQIFPLPSCTLWEIFTPSPSAAAGLWAALWRVCVCAGVEEGKRRGREPKFSCQPVAAEKIYPLENVGISLRSTPLMAFNSSEIVVRETEMALVMQRPSCQHTHPDGGLALSYWFLHPIYRGSIRTDMQ